MHSVVGGGGKPRWHGAINQQRAVALPRIEKKKKNMRDSNATTKTSVIIKI